MLSLTSMFPGMVVRRSVVYECLDAMDASNAETAETLNGLGFNKEMQAKKTRNFSENDIGLARALFTSLPFCCTMNNGSLSLLLKDA
ncbi:hypothetical protein Tco_0505949 [Tanacetum coccineum]